MAVPMAIKLIANRRLRWSTRISAIERMTSNWALARQSTVLAVRCNAPETTPMSLVDRPGTRLFWRRYRRFDRPHRQGAGPHRLRRPAAVNQRLRILAWVSGTSVLAERLPSAECKQVPVEQELEPRRRSSPHRRGFRLMEATRMRRKTTRTPAPRWTHAQACFAERPAELKSRRSAPTGFLFGGQEGADVCFACHAVFNKPRSKSLGTMRLLRNGIVLELSTSP